MEPTPLHDVIQFLSKAAWYTYALWVLLLVSMAIAALTGSAIRNSERYAAWPSGRCAYWSG